MTSINYSGKFRELVLNWKLRLVVSALFSILGLAVLISITSGFIMDDFQVLDQTIVGVAVFVIVIPIYLIVADLPKIDEHTIAEMLNKSIPGAALILKSHDELSEEEKTKREEAERLFQDEKLYRFLPNRPVIQAFLLMTISLTLTAGIYFYFQ